MNLCLDRSFNDLFCVDAIWEDMAGMLNKWSKKDQKSSRGDRSIHRRPALEQKMRVGMVQVVPQRRQQGQVLLNLAVKWSLLLVAYAVVICGRLSGQHCCSAISCPMWMDHLQFICAQDAFRLCLSTLLLNAKTWEVPLMPF
ncbi:PREDICTED: uncharacterized protein LOC109160326 [Ipomoea nil]|uniref:uncharacterized protein LOC109160326 n=1 Tax=Ipomoea nil TaxID=35883 RepID=UPI00090092D1|nr:PREDICTED: uncharacterized protein LOC109160326 [Ipomoea nil]